MEKRVIVTEEQVKNMIIESAERVICENGYDEGVKDFLKAAYDLSPIGMAVNAGKRLGQAVGNGAKKLGGAVKNKALTTAANWFVKNNITPQQYLQGGAAPAQQPQQATAPAQPMNFNQAFANARKAGLQQFEYNGKQYSTQLANQPAAPAAPAAPAMA